jgi:hypothetical protein
VAEEVGVASLMKFLLIAALVPYTWFHPEEVALYNARFTLLQTEYAGVPVTCKPYVDEKWRCTGQTDEVWVRLMCYADEYPWKCEFTWVSKQQANPRWERRNVGSPNPR